MVAARWIQQPRASCQRRAVGDAALASSVVMSIAIVPTSLDRASVTISSVSKPSKWPKGPQPMR